MKEGVESSRTFLTSASLLSEELAGLVNICATVAALYSFSDFAGDMIVIIVEAAPLSCSNSWPVA